MYNQKNKEFLFGILLGYLLTIYLFNNRRDSSADISVNFQNLSSYGDRQQLARKQGKLLCWVVTAPQNQFKALMVKETWGRRCDKLLFFSSRNDTSLPAIGLPIEVDSRNQLWNKAKLTYRYIYSNFLDEYDWFYKADDDTYTIVENLRRLLSSMNFSEPLILGRRFHDFVSGGSGYVMTRETIRRLVEQGLDKDICKSQLPGRADDLILGNSF